MFSRKPRKSCTWRTWCIWLWSLRKFNVEAYLVPCQTSTLIILAKNSTKYMSTDSGIATNTPPVSSTWNTRSLFLGMQNLRHPEIILLSNPLEGHLFTYLEYILASPFLALRLITLTSNNTFPPSVFCQHRYRTHPFSHYGWAICESWIKKDFRVGCGGMIPIVCVITI